MWPVLVLAGLQILGLGIHLEQHGNPKTGKENAWVGLIALLFINAILYWGGWFAPLF